MTRRQTAPGSPICVGAFTLAATGLLDGLRATTHWAAAGELSRLHPRVEVDADVLYLDNGQILTSAGAAGLDLCLHMIRQDHGSVVAADAARANLAIQCAWVAGPKMSAKVRARSADADSNTT